MNRQIKYGFKKEWLQFTRTFRLGGIILAIFSFALADPLMYRLLAMMMEMMFDPSAAETALSFSSDFSSEMYSDMASMSAVFNDAGMIFSVTMAEFCSTSVLIVLLILMSPAGGEQKKRATIIPSCCGLDFFNYLVPKFVLYPLTVFLVSFISALTAGGLCNALFTDNKVDFGMMLLAALLCAVYMAFVVTVYLGAGLCTSRPGVVTIFVYIGTTLVELILSSLELTKYHPFALRSIITSQMFTEGFSLEENVASIIVGCVLAVVIAALMFFLTLAVLRGTKINNQEDRPEF